MKNPVTTFWLSFWDHFIDQSFGTSNGSWLDGNFCVRKLRPNYFPKLVPKPWEVMVAVPSFARRSWRSRLKQPRLWNFLRIFSNLFLQIREKILLDGIIGFQKLLQMVCSLERRNSKKTSKSLKKFIGFFSLEVIFEKTNEKASDFKFGVEFERIFRLNRF